VDLKIYSGTTKSDRLPLYRIVFFFFFLVLTSVSPVEANVPGDVTFSWQANPSEDYVIGYRLYYGGDSRLNSNGTPKANFSYDYYIDFSDLKRCDAYDGSSSCKILTPEELQCESLYGSVPQCTISNLHGRLYFALTAYNAQAESGYTPELRMTVNPEALAAVQQEITLLLLKNNK
jgi:hypothetical protein